MLIKQEINFYGCKNVKIVFEEPKRPQMDVNKFSNSDMEAYGRQIEMEQQ